MRYEANSYTNLQHNGFLPSDKGVCTLKGKNFQTIWYLQ